MITKKVENNLRKNEVNLPNHVHPMWQVDYTFSGGIQTQAVFGVDTDHGEKGRLIRCPFMIWAVYWSLVKMVYFLRFIVCLLMVVRASATLAPNVPKIYEVANFGTS